MGDSTMTAADSGVQIQHGDHIDTIESVDLVFRAQRKLSFTYGAVFFAVTLAIPALSVWWKSWYAVQIWGGFTANYLFVSLLYYVFLWGMAWTYSKQADKLDERLGEMADVITATAAAKGSETE
ncbi:MAG: hypothetical protein CVT66_06065 [Actinobacteria bacterium HGW-Actinobacteria-6]|nr:MAG: hypothetical protein CVT66_06065 [Actinobacteria bacterium HGW-Actinobacteria-6]